MIDEDMLEEVQEVVWTEVARGEADFDEVVEAAVDYLAGQADEETLRAVAREAAMAGFAAHAEAQRSWGDGPLDTDRLDAAFRELDAAGIVARAGFTCCQTCGFAEIGGEAPEGESPRGFTFCHQQDVESALHGGGLYLAFGSFSKDIAPEEIATEVVRVLVRHGFAPEWNGEVGRRVFLPMTWRVRRDDHPGREEPADA
ncbi:DUF6891 domain-containing protein [Actinomadura namibiensis]|uniref:DUF6891 domain-containing protein n=1 Tax=Actinomadura namibiensis TaxID=182080 RepID=A0A7W3LX64_ACTNM|nr:hypothetical protein [Actinomadura namibiensis]MBA8955892.1 hypothetical protein [Actinomadura namibiensis]